MKTQTNTKQEIDELVERIKSLEGLPREEVLSMSGEDYVKYITFLRLQKQFSEDSI